MNSNIILQTFHLDFQWPTQEPFLFCVHHNDAYPKGTGDFGPGKKYLKDRELGQDFQEKNGFRMYHGEVVPGFPVHPHRGFETITIVRKGYVDHADSLGAAGRYGEGDVQWMTAGKGVQHSEMFPLLHQEKENTTELFQIWLNLPKKSKFAPAHFKMFWSEKIPKVQAPDGKSLVTVIAGEFTGTKAIPPAPDSWAADTKNEVMIILVKMQAGAQFSLPASKQKTNRTLYFFEGSDLQVNDQTAQSRTGHILDSQLELRLQTPSHMETQEIEVLILQAAPIGEPVFQHGPFVMNTRQEIIQTIEEFQQTHFGGWSWPKHDMVHGSKIERFAKYPDGHIEKP